MRSRLATKKLFASVFLAVALCSAAASADPPVGAAPPAPAAARPIYRFEFTITGADDGPHPVPLTYTLVLEENRAGAVSTGTNIPLQVAPMPGTTPSGVPFAAPRQDIGLALHCTFAVQGSVLVLEVNAEMSTVERNNEPIATIHRWRSEGVALVTPGTPSLVTSINDLTSRRHYQVMVTATRLR